MIRFGLLAASCFVALYVGVVLILWRFQERVVFQPPSRPSRPDLDEAHARRVRYRSDDGVELHAFVVGECDANVPVLLAFHGNAELARWNVPWANHLASRVRVCVVLPEYRGYDGLAGAPSYEGSARDARAALAYLRDTMHVDSTRIAYFGHSLGSAIAAELAAEAPPRTLILQAPFSSAREMARRLRVPGLSAFWGLVSRVHFDTVRRVRTLPCPVYVAHGARDVIVPFRMGRAVFESALRSEELLVIPDAGHNDVPDTGGAEYWRWLVNALVAIPV